MRYITICATIVVCLSVIANVMTGVVGMRRFGSILDNTSRSLAFWSAMGQESVAFDRYVKNRTEKNLSEYQAACTETEQKLKQLPFDYREIGPERYARTCSVYNMYEQYVREREALIVMDRNDELYVEQLSLVHRLQDYLDGYAGMLEQMTIEMGNHQYVNRQYLMVAVPAVSMVCGLAALYAMKASIWNYIRTLKEKHEVEKRLSAVSLQMLKNQINPHFLFNTLNMIASTAQIEDAATTEKMIEALSRLFRYNLKSSDSVMPLERELKVVQDYMYLQQMRFGKRIRYFADCEEDTLQVLIPSFILQPLVENAIKHGLSASSQGGKIVVRTWIHDNRLWISVADTGSGMSAERLEEVRRALETDDDRKVGIGVRNIYRRVLTMYQDGEMYVDSIEGCGTAVQIVFSPERYREV
ncbi:MAG: histidine kinase [Eubacteriales bacterium]|nr:histidine kinase [Eubacteriales bacterium]